MKRSSTYVGHRFLLPVLMLLLFCCFFLLNGYAQGPGGLWNDVAENAIAQKGPRHTVPQRYRTLSLNVGALRQLLLQVPHERNAQLRSSAAIITLPLPDGQFARFRFIETPVMAPELSARFPQIRTFTGIGVDDPSLSVVFDFSPNGFHGMVHSAATGLSFIDPYSQGYVDHYIAYFKKDYIAPPNKSFPEVDVLGQDSETAQRIAARVALKNQERMGALTTEPVARPSGDQLRTYRVAIAATGEYTSFYGGTVSGALSGINTTLSRVNFIYIREVDIRMILVANNTSIIYTNALTDPYANGNPGTMINQAQANIDAVIGPGNYDIGHVFGTNSGGLASLGVVCRPGYKARGVTGSGAPIGDAFDVDYVAHEMGHQFGANHTFNGNAGACAGNRNAGTAYEPGSGSTIMAYAGICSPQDLQPNSDAYFHTVSYDEIFAYSELDLGNSCAVITSPANTAPVPTVVTTNNLTIPKQTPFTIVGSATDLHGDPITYNWEQYDLGPEGSPTAPSGNAPIFRSFTALNFGVRTFPKQSDLLNNTTTIGEVLPTYARSLHFSLTVRDNYASGGGVDWAPLLTVNVSGTAGPFVVTAPNTNVNLAGGAAATVTWNVSGTNLSPINCANVRISLSTNGGLSFPTELAATTPNDGSQSVTLPNISTTTARIKVEAVGNIFFDLSNVNFRITATPAPTITNIAPTSGNVAVGVAIKGTNFVGVSAIRFNGATATETYLATSTLLYAKVPSGATTGKVQVVAAGGSVTSAGTFTVAAISSKWVTKTSLATARIQHGAIAANGKVYVFGGYNSGGHVNNLAIYTPSTNSWSNGASMPVATRGMAYALGSNGAIYIFGGATTVNTVANAYRYTPATNSWAAITAVPVAVYEAAAAATSNGKIYLFGGELATDKSNATNATRIYTISTNSWSTGAAMPVAMKQHSAVVGADGKIYVFGGRTTTNSAPSGLVQIYNPSTNTWSTGAGMLIPKVQFGLARGNDGKLYVVGGKAQKSNYIGPFFHSVEVYNPATNSWATGSVLPTQVGHLSAVNLNGNLHALGGTSTGSAGNFNFQLILPPAAPSNLVATAVSTSRINLSWKDNAANESGFTIERATSSGGPFAAVATVGANVVSYANTGLSSAVTYYYRVKGTNAGGSSGYSNVAFAKTASGVASEIVGNDSRDLLQSNNSLSVSPNPAKGGTRISFTVAEDQRVQLVVYDVQGRLVEQLYDGAAEGGRTYQFDWKQGNRTPGTYIGRLVTQDGMLTERILLLP